MPVLEVVLVLFAGAAGLVIAGAGAARPLRVLLPAAWLAIAGAAIALGGQGAAKGDPASAAPAEIPRSGSVGSGACRSCHPGEYASWHRSYHRSMTRLAEPHAVAGPFDGTELDVDGRSVELSRRGEELWARLPDPDLVARATLAGSPEPSAAAPLVSRRVLLVTGSHHHEVYWVRGERGNELRLVPVTYLVAERRLVPRRDAFLQPPDAPSHAIRWNSNCIQCHSTLGRPQHDLRTDRFESEATELGIACEACHGPGAAHVRRHQNPFERLTTTRDAPDPSIVNPARLGAERASEVCGQCHAYFVPRDEVTWWTSGFATSFTPGDALERSRALVNAEPRGDDAERGSVNAEARSLFWDDGTIRVGGREYNALARSACFRRGHGERKLSCLSCHSMHASEPDDQLRSGASVDEPCRRCHTDIARAGSGHTHHAAGSAGSSCVGCHMPYTSYALFTGIRSHRIDSPSASATSATSRPNACNLCHLDRTLDWTAKLLGSWYGRPSAPVPDASTSAALRTLLTGDAAERAILAWAFGRREAQRASGSSWEAAFLAELGADPYAAVRKVACDSLRTLPGFERFGCDFTAEPAERRATRERALSRWRTQGNARKDPALLLDARGARDEARLAALLATRNVRPTTISE